MDGPLNTGQERPWIPVKPVRNIYKITESAVPSEQRVKSIRRQAEGSGSPIILPVELPQ